MDFRAYLFFGGNCRDAFSRYQEIFGGELTVLSMADAPSDTPVPPEQVDLVIHAALTLDGAVVMGSDDPTGGFSGVRGCASPARSPTPGRRSACSVPSPTAVRPRSR